MMDFYSRIVELLADSAPLDEWPEMRSILRRAAGSRPRDWQLPVLAAEAVGGTPRQALPAAAAAACLQISIILIDDLLDDDPRGEYRRMGAAAAANLASAFQAAGLEVLARSPAQPDAILMALQSLDQMLLTTAFGQHQDAQNPADEEDYWRLVENKSSPFYGAVLHVGALLGGATIEIAGQIEKLGRLYGAMIQIHDDLNDTMALPAGPDWILGRSPLPILFAQSVAHPERERFIELRRLVADPAALAEAQMILIRCGAISYCVDRLLRRYLAARDLLASISLAQRAGLETLLETQVTPVRKLFQTMGMSLPEALEGIDENRRN
ncbi:MAG: polyprenyl synthetase family protein [Ardenticatenaceae bacterium]